MYFVRAAQFSPWFSLLLLLLPWTPALAQTAADEQLLKKAGVDVAPAALLEFFRARGSVDPKEVQDWIRRLQATAESEHQQASAELIQLGPPALPFLQEAMKNDRPEVRERAKACLEKIAARTSADVEVAALRVLVERQPPGAVAALLEYVPTLQAEWVKMAALRSLGQLALTKDRVDPALLQALKSSQPAQRAAAGYVLAQYGNWQQRDLVRPLLQDAEEAVRSLVVAGLVGRQCVAHQTEFESADKAALQRQGLALTEDNLIDFLHKRTLSSGDQQNIQRLIQQLGSHSYRQREEASRRLAQYGRSALPLLKEALTAGDEEIVQRATLGVERIVEGPGTTLPAAVVRRLATVLTPTGANRATAALLAFAPFADDESVEEEILHTLCLLNARQPHVEPALLAALHDPQPLTRALAAHALGRVGTVSEGKELSQLLTDAHVRVRLGAAQGLLAAGQREAVPVLIQLLADMPGEKVWKIEEVLIRLAGEKAPVPSLTQTDRKARDRAVAAWSQWWQKQTDINLAAARPDDHHLGLITICEYDAQVGRVGGRVWECDLDGKQRWQISGLAGPMDAQVLSNGHVLIAENSGMRVTERDQSGGVHWEYRITSNPIACQRLPNGNTFIATYNEVLEVTPAKEIVYSHKQGPAFYIFSAEKLRNGHIVCMSAQGNLIEMDSDSGKTIRSFALGAGGWCGATTLPNGHYLVAQMGQGQIREIDSNGQEIWKAAYQGAFRATRLPNGNTLAASMTTRRIAEIDRNGNLRREINCQGRPWAVTYR